MTILIIGSTEYRSRMNDHAGKLEEQGHTVLIPEFDDGNLDSLGIVTNNRELIRMADEIHMFWNGRSQGTWCDFCMAFALEKPIKLVYLEEKSFRKTVKEYCHQDDTLA